MKEETKVAFFWFNLGCIFTIALLTICLWGYRAIYNQGYQAGRVTTEGKP